MVASFRPWEQSTLFGRVNTDLNHCSDVGQSGPKRNSNGIMVSDNSRQHHRMLSIFHNSKHNQTYSITKRFITIFPTTTTDMHGERGNIYRASTAAATPAHVSSHAGLI